ncbi:2TM domain-containing protein [Roseofilum casamattae]|uniref:2TM domain-containing protein n=1 Tax=Roseofilum casamattae BLCC-M143 TaxID=3022442 RepID=A0ABT7C0W7_9CYAN|nr:2TM domain-containing protein [Roseofilum casamattae]MDJ1185100.1 2TM domain-containing protein [Roseofilum casamattae BLCC-M143]
MSGSSTSTSRSYRQEDMQQILNLAISRKDPLEEFSYDQLLEIAIELDIPPEELQAAEQQWLEKQGKLEHQKQFDMQRFQSLKKEAGKYAIANTFLVLINVVSVGTLSWSLYVVLGWGLALGLKTWNTYQMTDDEYEQAFQKWYNRNQLKQAAEKTWQKISQFLWD